MRCARQGKLMLAGGVVLLACVVYFAAFSRLELSSLLRRSSSSASYTQADEPHVFRRWAQQHTGNVLWKPTQYFDVYDRVFGRLRGRENVTLVQLGVHAGGAIDMWKAHFGRGFVFHGVDVNPQCAQFHDPAHGVHIHIGSQTNRTLLLEGMFPKTNTGMIDVIVDDGAHFSDLTIATFTLLWPHLSAQRGIYLVEDLPGQHKVQNLFTDLAHVLRRSDPLGRCDGGEAAAAFPNFCQQAYSLTLFHNIAAWEKHTTRQPDRLAKYGQVDTNFGEQQEDELVG